MTELDSVKLLRGVLRTHLDWHGARLDFLARLAPVLSSKAKTSSNSIRLQRFFRGFTLAQADLARTVAWLLLPKGTPWVLTLDRTNWRLGRAEFNLLVLAVSYRGLSLPLFWRACARPFPCSRWPTCSRIGSSSVGPGSRPCARIRFPFAYV